MLRVIEDCVEAADESAIVRFEFSACRDAAGAKRARRGAADARRGG